MFIRAPNNCLTFFSNACLLADPEPASLGVDVFLGDNLMGLELPGSTDDGDGEPDVVRNL